MFLTKKYVQFYRNDERFWSYNNLFNVIHLIFYFIFNVYRLFLLFSCWKYYFHLLAGFFSWLTYRILFLNSLSMIKSFLLTMCFRDQRRMMMFLKPPLNQHKHKLLHLKICLLYLTVLPRWALDLLWKNFQIKHIADKIFQLVQEQFKEGQCCSYKLCHFNVSFK